MVLSSALPSSPPVHPLNSPFSHAVVNTPPAILPTVSVRSANRFAALSDLLGPNPQLESNTPTKLTNPCVDSTDGLPSSVLTSPSDAGVSCPMPVCSSPLPPSSFGQAPLQSSLELSYLAARTAASCSVLRTCNTPHQPICPCSPTPLSPSAASSDEAISPPSLLHQPPHPASANLITKPPHFLNDTPPDPQPLQILASSFGTVETLLPRAVAMDDDPESPCMDPKYLELSGWLQNTPSDEETQKTNAKVSQTKNREKRQYPKTPRRGRGKKGSGRS